MDGILYAVACESQRMVHVAVLLGGLSYISICPLVVTRIWFWTYFCNMLICFHHFAFEKYKYYLVKGYKFPTSLFFQFHLLSVLTFIK